MKLRFFSLTVSLGMALAGRSAVVPTDISAYPNIVYADEAFLSDDLVSAVLTLNLKNNQEICGIQFDMTLPEGVEISAISTIQDRLDGAPEAPFNKRVNGDYGIAYFHPSSIPFEGTDGPVFSVSLTIDENVASGDYPVIIKNIVLANTNGEEAAKIEESVVSVLHVAVPHYADGYSLTLEPVDEFDPEGVETSFVLTCNTEITNVSFDVLLPQLWVSQELYSLDKVLKSTQFNFDSSETNKYVHVVIDRKGSNKIASGTEIATLSVADEMLQIVAGIYPIQVLNIRLKDVNGMTYDVVPSTSYLKVGTPSEGEATVSFIGNVSSEVISAFMDDVSVGTIDLSAVTSIDGSLKLADDKNIVAPRNDVPVEKVEYVRVMPEITTGTATKFGTICVPFALESNTDIQYYKLSGVSSTAMTFTEVLSVEAGTPALFKVLTGKDVAVSESNVTLKSGPKEKEETVSGAVWTMKGSYEAITVDPTGKSISYINGDKFYTADISFPVPAYRAWFESSSIQSVSSVRTIIDGSEEGTTDVEFRECVDGKVHVVFNLAGQQISAPESGKMFISNGQKFLGK